MGIQLDKMTFLPWPTSSQEPDETVNDGVMRELEPSKQGMRNSSRHQFRDSLFLS